MIEPQDRRRPTREIFETTEQTWFVVTTKAKAPDPYPEAFGGGAVLPCVYSLTEKYQVGDTELTQRDSTRYDLIYVPNWVAEGTTIRAVRMCGQLYGVQRDQPYTVRRYDSSGNTLWVQDYFRGAVSGEWTTAIDLSVATIGSRVFVGGPRVTHENDDLSLTYWNCCVYDLANGALLGKYDLWVPGYPTDGTAGERDIADVCAGADGNLGVLFADEGPLYGTAQAVASYDPSTLDLIWGDFAGFGIIPYFRWDRLEVDANGKAHMGGLNERARRAIKLDGTTEYQAGSHLDLSIWTAYTAFMAKSPGANYSPTNTLFKYTNIFFYNDTAWPDHITEENGVNAIALRTNQWWVLTTRGEITGTAMEYYSAADPASDIRDVAIMRDSGGAVTNIVGVGAGFVRGASQVGLVFDGGPIDYSLYPMQTTTGPIQDQGCVCIFSDSGTFLKAYSPVNVSTVTRCEAIPGAGYYLGAGSAPAGAARIMLRDASDAHVWAHHHQALTDLTTDSAGGVITVGLASKRSNETSFLTA